MACTTMSILHLCIEILMHYRDNYNVLCLACSYVAYGYHMLYISVSHVHVYHIRKDHDSKQDLLKSPLQ